MPKLNNIVSINNFIDVKKNLQEHFYFLRALQKYIEKYLPSIESGNIVLTADMFAFFESPVDVPDGSRTTYTTNHFYRANSLRIIVGNSFLNNDEFTETGNNTFSTVKTYDADERMRIMYIKVTP